MLFRQHKEYEHPLPPQRTYRLRTQRHIRQVWQCHPNTALILATHSTQVLQLTKNPPPNSAAQRAVSFPTLLPLMPFSSVTRISSGIKVQCWWHKYKWVEGCCWHLTNLARIGNSHLHKIPCAQAVTGEQVDLYFPLGPSQTVLVPNDLFVYWWCFGVLRYSVHVHTFRSWIVDSY